MSETLIPPFTVTVDLEALKVWARILKDPNPIHLDPVLVRAKGFPAVIVQGPANLAFIANALIAAFPGGTIEALDVRYLDNAFGGETVEAAGRVTGETRDGDLIRTACEVWLKAGGRPVIAGTAVVVRPVDAPAPRLIVNGD